MAEPAHLAKAMVLERLAGDLHSVAFDFREEARCIRFAERRIAEVERICSEARRVVRGS